MFETMSIDWIQGLAWGLLVAGFFLAIVGAIVPGLPGAIFIVLGMWGHEYFRPETFTWVAHTLILILALLSWLVDFLAGIWGARLGGATRSGLIGAALGGLAGLPFGFLGLIIGPFVGAVAGDLYAKRRDVVQLLRSGGGAALGFVFSLVARFVLLFLMAMVILFGSFL